MGTEMSRGDGALRSASMHPTSMMMVSKQSALRPEDLRERFGRERAFRGALALHVAILETQDMMRLLGDHGRVV